MSVLVHTVGEIVKRQREYEDLYGLKFVGSRKEAESYFKEYYKEKDVIFWNGEKRSNTSGP
jgi:hypothetical protein